MNRWCILLCVLAFFSGCQQKKVITWDSAKIEPIPYKAQLNAWTRQATAYHQIESRFYVKATCLSPSFIKAYARQHSETSAIETRKAVAFKAQQLESARDQIKFLVSLSTSDPYWNDISTKKSSLKATLYTGNGSSGVAPREVVKLTLKEQSDYQPMFSYLSPLTQGYLITFPKTATEGRLRLVIGGPPGSVELVWALQE